MFCPRHKFFCALCLLLGLPLASPLAAQTTYEYRAAFDTSIDENGKLAILPIVEIHNPDDNSTKIQITEMETPYYDWADVIDGPAAGTLHHRFENTCDQEADNAANFPFDLDPGEGLTLDVFNMVEGCIDGCDKVDCDPTLSNDCGTNCFCFPKPGQIIDGDIIVPDEGTCFDESLSLSRIEVILTITTTTEADAAPVVTAKEVTMAFDSSSGGVDVVGVTARELDRDEVQ